MTNLGTSGKDNVELVAPYITFFADKEQTFTLNKGAKANIHVNLFEYSVNGGAWSEFTLTADGAVNGITFGGEVGVLRLRGKSLNGTSNGSGLSSSYNVQFANPKVEVRCTGDIRTLIDYENYGTVST